MSVFKRAYVRNFLIFLIIVYGVLIYASVSRWGYPVVHATGYVPGTFHGWGNSRVSYGPSARDGSVGGPGHTGGGSAQGK